MRITFKGRALDDPDGIFYTTTIYVDTPEDFSLERWGRSEWASECIEEAHRQGWEVNHLEPFNLCPIRIPPTHKKGKA